MTNTLTQSGTVVFDTVGELSRLAFSKAIGKKSGDQTQLRAVQHYGPTTERLNILIRSMRPLLRTHGTEIVLIGHEQIDQLYASGSAMDRDNTPIGVRGIPDLPGKAFPEELLRKCDAVLRMRILNGKRMWISKPEPLGGGPGDSTWVAGVRAKLTKYNDMNPAHYAAIDEQRSSDNRPWLWMIYGKSKIGKTTSVLTTFPKPMIVFDFDDGTNAVGSDTELNAQGIYILRYDVEDAKAYDKFILDIGQLIQQGPSLFIDKQLNN